MNTDLYFDSNATTPVLPAAADALMDALNTNFGNPSSSHSVGLRARAVLDDVRSRASRLLGVGDGKLMFNSGATEGIQTAVLSALCSIREKREHGLPAESLLLYGATEHKAVPESLAHWNRVLGLDLELRSIPVDQHGRHDLAALARMAPDAALVCTMAANNETGVISDIKGIGAVLEHSPALWLVDCVQALGKLPVDLARTRIDYAPFSGHKLYAPKGTGMLYVRAGAPYTPLMMGGGQEDGLRSGTENLPGIAALGAVLAELENGTAFRTRAELTEMRNMVVAALSYSLPGIAFNTPFDKSLSTTVNFSVPGLASGQVLDVFDAAGIHVSAGSACSAAKGLGSYVLQSMGLPEWQCENAVRLSLGPATEFDTINAVCKRIIHAGAALRECGLVAGTSSERLDGIKLVSAGDTHCWLLLDSDTGAAVVIDPRAESHAQVEAILKRHQHTLVAELSTTDADSWPFDGDTVVLGQWQVKRLLVGIAAICYLVEGRDKQTTLAFTGSLRVPDLKGILPDHVLVCGQDGEIEVMSIAAPVPVSHGATEMHLDARGLRQLMREYPGTMLVDVRESCEHRASDREGLMGQAINLPLSQLVNALPSWLTQEDPLPIVFVCRSGRRSDRAARCLRRLGYGEAYHVAGGLAMEGQDLHSRT